MRTKLFIGLLGILILGIWAFPLLKSNAADTAQQERAPGRQDKPAASAFPDFDIRLGEDGEFQEYDLNTPAAAKTRASAVVQARLSAIDEFRSSLSPETSRNLRGVVNEAGAIKNLFVDGGTLSQPQSDTADNIARGFIRRHAAMLSCLAQT